MAIAARPLRMRREGPRARRRSLQGGLAGIAVIAVVAVVDAIVGENTILIGLLILGPLVACTRSEPGDVLAVGALALLVGLLLGIPNHIFATTDHLTRLLIVLAGSGMALWISLIRSSYERSADLLALQASVARILASASTLAAVTPDLLATLGTQLGWEIGELWMVEPRSNSIRCTGVWSAPHLDAERFVEVSRAIAFRPGEGVPGRVWESGRPVWVFDVSDEEDLPRAEAAAEVGLAAAFAFPIRGSSGILGTIEYFASTPRRPDGRLLDLMDALGSQLGDHVERLVAEEAVKESDARKTAVVQAALDCIVTMDGEGKIVEFNPAAERTFGYTAAEAIGKELAQLIVPPDLRERHRWGVARYLSMREPRMLDRRVELRAVRKDGSELPIELTVTEIGVEPPMFTGFLRDLTERREVEALQSRMAAMVESSDDAILSKDHDLIIQSWNTGAERLYGYTAEEAIGQPIEILIPEERHGEEVLLFERVLRDERVEHYETERIRKDGSRIDVSLTVSPIREADGTVSGASVIGRDISELKRSERRASFLAEAQSVLSSTLDYEETLRNIARLVVPDLSDWCSIDMVGPDGSLKRLALAHVDPAKEQLAYEIERKYPPRHDPEQGALKAVRTGRSELMREIPQELLDEAARNDEHARMIQQLGLRSAMIVPLLVRERAIGAITFVSAESKLLFDEDDLALAEDLATRAATAVDNARLYGERSYIADTLQRSLMPDRLPDIPGLDVAARYRVAGEANEVGGDFYDVYRSGESTWGVVIGDVRGKGPAAAVVTGLARYTLRTASLSDSRPSHVLRMLNEAMVLQPGNDRFCTVAYASLEPAAGGRIHMTLGVGGHPLPFLIRRDGSVGTVGRPGTLIGFVRDPELVDETIELQPGESLVMYTDGVSEARSEAGLFGEERLVELLRSCSGLDAADVAARIESDVLEFSQGRTSDDIAVLVLRVQEPHEQNGARETQRLEPVRRTPA